MAQPVRLSDYAGTALGVLIEGERGELSIADGAERVSLKGCCGTVQAFGSNLTTYDGHHDLLHL